MGSENDGANSEDTMKETPREAGTLRVALMPLGALEAAKRNPKKHTSDISTSIGRFGYVEPIVLDERTGRIVAGHGRREALMAMRKRGEQPPAGVVSDGDEWRVPVLRGWASRSDAEAEAYLLASNKLTEVGGWDESELGKIIADLAAQDALDGVGFDDQEIARLLEESKAEAGEPDEEPEEPDDADVYVKPGELWALGDHRLVCGDSTSSAVLEQLDAPSDAALFYDPPWDAEMPAPELRGAALVFTDGRRMRDAIEMFGAPTWVFVWDCGACWYTPNRPLQRMKLALWYGEIGDYDQDGAHYGEPDEEREVENSRGSYHYKPDPRGKHLADLFACQLARMHAESGHRHAKPVDWLRLLIGDCTRGDVFDPFAGSGAALIACEQLGRRCFAVEKEPKFAQMIIERWQKFTGRSAEKLP